MWQSKLAKALLVGVIVVKLVGRLPVWVQWRLKLLLGMCRLPIPVIGNIPAIPAATHDINSLILIMARKDGYKPKEYAIPGAKMVCLYDEPDLKFFLKDNWQNFLKNSDNIKFVDWFEEILGEGIFAVDGEQWKTHRKVASVLFSRNALRNKMEDVFISHSKDLVEALKNMEGRFDLQMVLAAFTFDTICEIAFGHHPQALEKALKGEKLPFLEAFDGLQNLMTRRTVIPDPIWKFMRRFNIGHEGQLSKYAKVLRDYVDDIVIRRKREITESSEAYTDDSKKDLLTLYILHGRKTNDPKLCEDSTLRDVVMSFMLAGRDTTSSTLISAFRLLSENPMEKAKVLKSLEWNKALTWDALRENEVLDRCVSETLRMYPPVGTDLRVCIETTTTPSNFTITKGTAVVLPNYALGRNPELFENPDKFDIDRWDDFIGNMEYKLPIFWGGPRICLGKEAARFEIKLVLAAVLPYVDIVTELKDEDSFLNGGVTFHRGGVMANARKKN